MLRLDSRGSALQRQLCQQAAQRYRPDRFAYHFARGKLGSDPVFAGLLARGAVPDGARIIDLGCGQGLLAAWLEAAAASYRAGEWHAAWPPPPSQWRYHGIELSAADVRRARVALDTSVRLDTGDLRHCDFGAADAVVLLDVLHYLPAADQVGVLRRIRQALLPEGVLLLRVGDAAAGLPFRLSTWVDRLVIRLRGHGRVRLHCRPLQEWRDLLTQLGFRSTAIPMGEGLFFANVLLVARPA